MKSRGPLNLSNHNYYFFFIIEENGKYNKEADNEPVCAYHPLSTISN